MSRFQQNVDQLPISVKLSQKMMKNDAKWSKYILFAFLRFLVKSSFGQKSHFSRTIDFYKEELRSYFLYKN